MWIFIIWLIGYFVSYFLCRYCCREFDGSYTKGDRVKNILRSILSWIMVIFAIVIMITEMTDDNEEAKW